MEKEKPVVADTGGSNSPNSKSSSQSSGEQKTQNSKISTTNSDLGFNDFRKTSVSDPPASKPFGEGNAKRAMLVSVASGSSLASTNSSVSSTAAHTQPFLTPVDSPKSPSQHHHNSDRAPKTADFVYRNSRMRRKSISEAINLAVAQEAEMVLLSRLGRRMSGGSNGSQNSRGSSGHRRTHSASKSRNSPSSFRNYKSPRADTLEIMKRFANSPSAISKSPRKEPHMTDNSSPGRSLSGRRGSRDSNKSTNLAALALFQKKNPTERIVPQRAFSNAKDESKYHDRDNAWQMESKLLEKLFEMPSSSASTRRLNCLRCLCAPCRCTYEFFCSLRCTNFVLTLLFVFISVATFAVLVIILFWVQNERNVQKFRSLLISNALDSLRQRIKNYYTLLASAYSALEKSGNNMSDLSVSTECMYSAVRAFTMTGLTIPFYYFYAGKLNGDYTLFFQNTTASGEKKIFWGLAWDGETKNDEGNRTYQVFMLENPQENREMKLSPTWNFTELYEPNDGSIWVQSATTNEGYAWTMTYTSVEDPQVVLLTLTKPIFNETGALKGYVAIDANVPIFTKFLEEIPLGSEFQSYILETKTGFVISASKAASVIPTKLDNYSLPIRYTYETALSTDIYFSSKFLIEKYQTFENVVVGAPMHDFYLMGYLIPHYLSYYRLKDGGGAGIDWIIVFDLPYIYLNLEIVLIIPLSIIILIVIFILAFCCTFFSSILLFWNFNTLKQQAQKVETLDLDHKIFKRPKSLFSEIRAVQVSFYNMVIMLKEFKPYIPAFLLERVQNKMMRESINERKEQEIEPTIKKEKSKAKLKENTVVPAEDGSKLKATKSSSSGSDEEEGEKTPSSPKDDHSFSFLHMKRSNIPLTRMKKRAVLSGGFEMGRLAVVHVTITSSNLSLTDLSFDVVKQAKKFHAVTLEIIMKHVNKMGGFMIHSTLDSFTFMFSSRRQCKEAVVAAWNIMQESRFCFSGASGVEGLEFSDAGSNASSNMGFAGVSLKIGISSSFCFYGSLGSRSWRVFSVVGDAVMEAKSLSRQAKYIFPSSKAVVLVTEEITNWANDRFLFRSLGVWRIQKPGIRNVDTFKRNYDESDIPEDYFEMVPVYKLEDQKEKNNNPDFDDNTNDQTDTRSRVITRRVYDAMDQCWRLLENGDTTNAEFLFRNGIALDPQLVKTDPIFLFLKRMIETKCDCWTIHDIGRMIYIDHANSLKRINNDTETETDNVIEIPNAIGKGDAHEDLFPGTSKRSGSHSIAPKKNKITLPHNNSAGSDLKNDIPILDSLGLGLDKKKETGRGEEESLKVSNFREKKRTAASGVNPFFELAKRTGIDGS